MNTKIHSIFSDFGMVIGLFDHMKTCKKLTGFSTLSAEEIYSLVFKTSGVERRFNEGRLTFVQFHEEVVILIGADKNNLTPDIFFDIWGDIFEENPVIITLLEKLSPEIKLFILSNTNSVHWKFMEKLPAIKKFFPDDNQRVLSFQVGEQKPSEKIFAEAIRRSGNNPEESIFIDDIGEYVSAARTFGINAIQYDCRTDSIKKLKRELEQYGVFGK